MLEYLHELEIRSPKRFRSLVEKPRTLVRVSIDRDVQFALFELIRRTALIKGEYNVCELWQQLEYSINADDFSLWCLPPESREGWINVKITMLTGFPVYGMCLFAPKGVWPLAMRLDAQEVVNKEQGADSEDSSNDLL